MNPKSVVKASKTKKFPYKNDKAIDDKNLILMNREILVMRVQNDSKLKICSVFSTLSSEFSLTGISQDETFFVQDMQFLSDEDQRKLAKNHADTYVHKNILALIDNTNRVFLLEIVVDYEKEILSCFIFADMPSREVENCLQIAWASEHLLILKEDGLLIDRKLKLKTRSVFHKQQYQIPQYLGCKKIVVRKVDSSDDLEYFGVTGNLQKVFKASTDSSVQVIVSNSLGISIDEEISLIIVSGYGDVIVLTNKGKLFQLNSQTLEVLSTSSFDLEEDEIVQEAHADNTLTSIFALTSRNVLYQIFLQKVTLVNGKISTFISRGVFRFHHKNTLFTFRVLAAPNFLENCIQTKNAHSAKTIQESFESFMPSPSTAKYFLYSLLTQESDNMKIFLLSLSSHETLIQDSEIAFVHPLKNEQNKQEKQIGLDSQNREGVNQSNMEEVSKLKTVETLTSSKAVNRSLLPRQQDPILISPEKEESLKLSTSSLPLKSPLTEIVQEKIECKELSQDIQETKTQSGNGIVIQQLNIEQPKIQTYQEQLNPDSSKVISFQQQGNSGKSKLLNWQNLSTPLENIQLEPQLEIKANSSLQKEPTHNLKPNFQSPLDKLNQNNVQHKQELPFDVLESLNPSKIEAVFHKSMDKMTKTLDNYFESKLGRLEVIVSSKIDKLRKDPHILGLVEECTAQAIEKTENVVREEISQMYSKQVEPEVKGNILEMFSYVSKTFENGQKFYNEKIQQEKEKCKIQNENTDEILALVKKITGPFSESAITHKKILADLAYQSSERRQKLEQFDKNLTTLLSRQEQILTKINSLEKNISEQISETTIAKSIEISMQAQIPIIKQKFDQTIQGIQNVHHIPTPPNPNNGNNKPGGNQYLREGAMPGVLPKKKKQGDQQNLFSDIPQYANGNFLLQATQQSQQGKKLSTSNNQPKPFPNNSQPTNEFGKSKKTINKNTHP